MKIICAIIAYLLFWGCSIVYIGGESGDVWIHQDKQHEITPTTDIEVPLIPGT